MDKKSSPKKTQRTHEEKVLIQSAKRIEKRAKSVAEKSSQTVSADREKVRNEVNLRYRRGRRCYLFAFKRKKMFNQKAV